MGLYIGNQKFNPVVSNGITPSGTTNIKSNGSYNVTNIANINVNIEGLTRAVTNGAYGVPANFTFNLPDDALDVEDYALYYAFYYSTNLASINLNNLTNVTGENAFNSAFTNCENLVGALDLSSINNITGKNAFANAFTYTGVTSVDLSNLTTINGKYCCSAMFRDTDSLVSADLSGLISITGESSVSQMFMSTHIASIDFSNLTSIEGRRACYSTFSGCSSLQSISFPRLRTIKGDYTFEQAFTGCSNLQSVSFDSLETIGDINETGEQGSVFSSAFPVSASSLTQLSFPNLTSIYINGDTPRTGRYSGTFHSCSKIEKMYFPKLNTITYTSGASTANQNACKYIFSGCSSLTELHFGATNQAAIEATAGYSTAWGRGAGNVTIYFDL